jgi:hypothetical protein
MALLLFSSTFLKHCISQIKASYFVLDQEEDIDNKRFSQPTTNIEVTQAKSKSLFLKAI